MANNKAFALENSNLNQKNQMFQLTIDQLNYFGDSLMQKMKKVANENGIKDKNIKSLQYQLETFNKTDTIVIRDTIFKNTDFVLDTCIFDTWSKNKIHLEYPGTIELSHQYYNDKYIILDSHKEPIKPRKWFLPKLFTKKHTVVEITVIDENPYVTTEKQRFIEIIK